MITVYSKVGLSVFLISSCMTHSIMYHTTYASLRGDWKQKLLVNLSILPYSVGCGAFIGFTWPGLLLGGSYFLIKKNL
jgi:hypothetical protein